MVDRHEAIYRRLAEHLDTLPDGYPPTETGVELRVLKRLFTPAEATLAVHLTLERETAAVIAERAALPTEAVARRLSEMAQKGLIFSVEPSDGQVLYQAVPFVVGIFEFQVDRLSSEFLADLAEYAAARGEWPQVKTIPQLRTIPVGLSIESQPEVLPYERVEELVAAHDRFAVAPCLCRKAAQMTGGGCEAPLETCMIFGDWAEYYVRTGRGRKISREEVAAILKQANEANLVLQPSNTKDATVICCCCGCCCGVLTRLKSLPNPASEVASSYRARYDRTRCIGCRRCLSRCQMEAIGSDGDRIALAEDRCIGCGLCVGTCPSGALTLARRERAEAPPDDIDAMWRVMHKAQLAAKGDPKPESGTKRNTEGSPGRA